MVLMETPFEHILLNSHKAYLISYMNEYPLSFEEAIKLTLTDKKPYSWRAAWLLWSCMEVNDRRIRKHVKDIINILPDRKDNQQRELLKILQQMQIMEEFEGLLFDHCVEVWEKINKQPSVRFNAFKMIVQIAKKHPDLSKEIFSLTQIQYMESLSPGVKKSIYQRIKEIRF